MKFTSLDWQVEVSDLVQSSGGVCKCIFIMDDGEIYEAIGDSFAFLADTLQEMAGGTCFELAFEDPVSGEPLPDTEQIIYCNLDPADLIASPLLWELLRASGANGTVDDSPQEMREPVKFCLQELTFGPRQEDHHLMLRCWGAEQTEENVAKIERQFSALIAELDVTRQVEVAKAARRRDTDEFLDQYTIES